MTVDYALSTKQADPLQRWKLSKETIEMLEPATVAYLKKIAAIRCLSPSEEEVIAIMAIRGNDPDALQQLITHSLYMVVEVVLPLRYFWVPLDDLISEGELALIGMVKSYNPASGISFCDHAVSAVENAVRHHIAANWSIVERPHWLDRQLHAFFAAQAVREQKPIADTDECVVSGNLLEVIMSEMLAFPDQQLNCPITTTPKEVWVDQIPDMPGDQAIQLSQFENALQRALMGLSYQEYDIINRRWLQDGATESFAYIGREYGRAKEKIEKIEEEAFKKLRRMVEQLMRHVDYTFVNDAV